MRAKHCSTALRDVRWIIEGIHASVASKMRKSLIGFVLIVFCGALGSTRSPFCSQAINPFSYSIWSRDWTVRSQPDRCEYRYSTYRSAFQDFVMADDPAFSRGAFLTANSLQVNFHFWPLLLQPLRIKQVILYDPVINIVRNQAGAYNSSSFD